MIKSTLFPWAAQMLAVIHQVDPTVVGDIGGMSSSDGHWVDKNVAALIGDALGTQYKRTFEGTTQCYEHPTAIDCGVHIDFETDENQAQAVLRFYTADM